MRERGLPNSWPARSSGDTQRAFDSLQTRPVLSMSGQGLPGTDQEAAFGTEAFASVPGFGLDLLVLAPHLPAGSPILQTPR